MIQTCALHLLTVCFVEYAEGGGEAEQCTSSEEQAAGGL